MIKDSKLINVFLQYFQWLKVSLDPLMSVQSSIPCKESEPFDIHWFLYINCIWGFERICVCENQTASEKE